MNTIKKISVLIVMISVFFSLIACQDQVEDQQKDISDEPKKLLIGFSMATYKEERWLRDRDIFLAKAKEAGFEVIVQNANNDSNQQYTQVVDMIEKGIDVLVIAPHDAVDAKRAVTRAKSVGIPVISYDRLVEKANVDVYISFDNVRVGELMGEAMINAIPKGGYVLLNGSENDKNSNMFREGYVKAITPAIDSGDVNIIAETWVADWRRETAYDYTYDILKRKGHLIQGIIAANDSLAWAAIDVLSENRMTKTVKVVGHDADLAACKRIVAGTQLMTVYKPISKLVNQTIMYCRILSKHEPILTQNVIHDGKFDVPYIKIDVVPVTKDNIDETVIKDGFHLKEDVYQ